MLNLENVSNLELFPLSTGLNLGTKMTTWNILGAEIAIHVTCQISNAMFRFFMFFYNELRMSVYVCVSVVFHIVTIVTRGYRNLLNDETSLSTKQTLELYSLIISFEHQLFRRILLTRSGQNFLRSLLFLSFDGTAEFDKGTC